MIRHAHILLAQKGATLLDGRVEQHIVDGQLQPEPIITYLEFQHSNGNQWIDIVSTDEQTMMHLATETEVSIGTVDEKGLVYQISPISDSFRAFAPFIGRQLLTVTELNNCKVSDLSFGVKLYFEGGLTFAIWNQDYPIDRNRYIFNGALPDVVVEVPVW